MFIINTCRLPLYRVSGFCCTPTEQRLRHIMARICYIQEDEDDNDDDDDDDDDVDRFVLDNHVYNWRFIRLETVRRSTSRSTRT